MTDPIDPGLIRVQLDRVLTSATFADADRASRFLRFVIASALEGQASAIKESVIAVEVFGRAASFDPKIDPIVRAEAGRLRTRLSAYYENEGKEDPVLIALPKGGYVPDFSERQLPVPLPKRIHPALLLTGGALLGVALALLVPHLLKRSGPRAEVQRLSLLPPPGSVVRSSVVSPDGRYLAFTASLKGSVALWIREFDTLEAKALPGTQGAAYPFWSPDSRSIGFFDQLKLKRIDLVGGPPETICEGGIARGATWGPSGVIVFAPHPSDDVLYQVPSSGGTPRAVTSLNRSRGELSHTFPQFLPDGRHFLYLVTSSTGSGPAIYAGSLDSMESKFLMHAGSSAIYAPAAHGQPASLLFEYQGALMSQPFDAQQFQMRSSRSIVAPEVWHEAGRADFSVSSNGVLAYQGRSNKDRQLTWLDRDGKLIEKVGPSNAYIGWNLSPGETDLVIVDEDPLTLRSAIWTMDLARRSLSRFMNVPEWTMFPIWSPNGTEILFHRRGEEISILQRKSLKGEDPVTVLSSPGIQFLTDWSADGKFVTYFAPRPGALLGISIVPVSGSGPQAKPRLFSSSSFAETSGYFSPAVGPQGPRWIAYTSDETGRLEIYARNFPSGDRKWRISTDGGWLPHWRSDNRELFYLALDGSMMATDIVVDTKVDTKDRAGFSVGLPHMLFRTSIRAPMSYPNPPLNTYAVSRDGRRFLVNGAANDEDAKAITVVLGSSVHHP